MTGKRCGFLLALGCVPGIGGGSPILASLERPLADTLAWPVSSDPQAAWSGTTWSGTFQSMHSGVSPFTITVLISPDENGNLVGTTSSAADCFTDSTLQVSVKARASSCGSDPGGQQHHVQRLAGHKCTLLNLNYVLNSSASGRCESDNGSGTLGER